MTQTWDFAGIHGHVAGINTAVGTTAGLLDDGKGTITRLQAAWEGDAANDWATVQLRWDASSTELNEALKDLALKCQQAADDMQSTEQSIRGSFGG